MTVSGRALAAGSGRIQNPRLAPCGSLNTRLNTNGGEPFYYLNNEKPRFERVLEPGAQDDSEVIPTLLSRIARLCDWL